MALYLIDLTKACMCSENQNKSQRHKPLQILLSDKILLLLLSFFLNMLGALRFVIWKWQQITDEMFYVENSLQYISILTRKS